MFVASGAQGRIGRLSSYKKALNVVGTVSSKHYCLTAVQERKARGEHALEEIRCEDDFKNGDFMILYHSGSCDYAPAGVTRVYSVQFSGMSASWFMKGSLQVTVNQRFRQFPLQESHPPDCLTPRLT